MAPFPPIFAYVIFGILDFIAFILYITGIFAIAGLFFSFLSTLLYILWVFFRYGGSKAVEKLFNLKQVDKILVPNIKYRFQYQTLKLLNINHV